MPTSEIKISTSVERVGGERGEVSRGEVRGERGEGRGERGEGSLVVLYLAQLVRLFRSFINPTSFCYSSGK